MTSPIQGSLTSPFELKMANQPENKESAKKGKNKLIGLDSLREIQEQTNEIFESLPQQKSSFTSLNQEEEIFPSGGEETIGEFFGDELEEKMKRTLYQFPILIAEDNSVNLKIISKLIVEKGPYQVDLVANGLEAFKKIEERSYSILFTDYHMPNMDGLELARKIRLMNDCQKRNIPIVVQSEATGIQKIFEDVKIECVMGKLNKIDQVNEYVKKFNLESKILMKK